MNEVFEFPGKSSVGSYLFLAIAIICFVLGGVFAAAWAVFGLTPLAIALTLFLGRIKSETVEVSVDSLVLQNGLRTIPFDSINGVWSGDANLLQHPHAPASPELLIDYQNGICQLYDSDRTQMRAFMDRILQSVKPAKFKPLPAPFVNQYLMEQAKVFDPQLITVVRQKPSYLAFRKSRNLAGRLALAFIAVAVITWVAVAMMYSGQGGRGNPDDFLAGFSIFHGVIFSIIGFISLVSFLSRRRPGIEAALVISPRGFALAQHKLDGSITWNEVKSVKKNRYGLQVGVAGATIIIPDIYDMPLSQIGDKMLANMS